MAEKHHPASASKSRKRMTKGNRRSERQWLRNALRGNKFRG